MPQIDGAKLKEVQASGDAQAYYHLLAEPLHNELYARKDFDFLEELTDAQQLLLCYDYVQNQVLQGGFIQLFQNHYVGLLPEMPRQLTTMNQEDMAQLIDDALKEYVLNVAVLEKETSVEEFAKLYDELPQFGDLDDRFKALHEPTVKGILEFATHHLEEFGVVI